jgi:hypothetical protein
MTRRWWILGMSTATVLAFLAGSAHAEQAPEEPSADAAPQGVPQRTWYGGPIVGADAGFVALTAASLVTRKENPELADLLITTAVVDYYLGGPIVHWDYGHGGRGFGSLALRAGLPITGILLGGAVGLSVNSVGEGVGVGFLGGIVMAPILDASLLAWHMEEPDSATATARWVFVPIVNSASSTAWGASALYSW